MRWQRRRHSAKVVVFLRIERINADAHAHHADFNQRFGHAIIDQHPVGPEHNDKAQPYCVAGNVENIRTDKRFTTGDDQQASLYLLRQSDR